MDKSEPHREFAAPSHDACRDAAHAYLGSSAEIILIDSRLLRRAALALFLRENLSANLREAGDAESGAALAASGEQARPLIILNAGGARVQEDAGLRASLQALRAMTPSPALVLFSDHDDRQEVLAALTLGVTGFIPTAMPPNTVIATLQMIQAGGEYAPRQALLDDEGDPSAARLSHGFGLASHAAHSMANARPIRTANGGSAGNSVQFTQRQMQVLELMRRGQPNKEIAYLLDMKESTVKVHVRNIMRKFSVTNRTQAAYLAMQMQ